MWFYFFGTKVESSKETIDELHSVNIEDDLLPAPIGGMKCTGKRGTVSTCKH